jgi:hypothetical protein
MDDWAFATPGHSATATTPAARHNNLFDVLRMLVSFIIVYLPLSSSSQMLPSARQQSGQLAQELRFRAKLYTGTCHTGNPPAFALDQAERASARQALPSRLTRRSALRRGRRCLRA